MGSAHVTQRHPQHPCIQTHHVQRNLDRDGIDLDEQGVHQADGAHLELGGLIELAVQAQLSHLCHQLGIDVGDHGDDTLGAQCHQGYHLVIVARPDVDVVAAQCQGVGDQAEVARSFLDAVDHGMLAQLVVGFCGESGAGSRGHVIHDDGGMYPVSDVSVVLDKTGLSGLIIIRSDDEQAIHAAGLCVQGQIQGGHGAVAAGAGDDLDPMIGLLDAVFDEQLFSVFDDTENILVQSVIDGLDEWRDSSGERSDAAIIAFLRKVLNHEDVNHALHSLDIIPPFSVVLVDNEMEPVADLITLDDENIYLHDDFWEKMDKELDDFFEQLMSDTK